MIQKRVHIPNRLALAVAAVLVTSTLVGAGTQLAVAEAPLTAAGEVSAETANVGLSDKTPKPAVKRPRIKLDLLMLRRG